jgi:hypothetical protein
VEFAGLQLQAHHPGGAKTSEEGAFAVDWDIWKVRWVKKKNYFL